MNGKIFNEDLVNYNELKICYDALGELALEPESKSMKGKLYHYTGTKVLNAILSKGCLRASNVFYLNDKIEYKMGIEVLKKIFQSDKEIMEYLEEISRLNGRDASGVYSISFSNKDDELQQWITYAKESGVCVELNSEIIWENPYLYMAIPCNEHSFVYYETKCFLKLAYEKGDLLSVDKLPQLDGKKIKRAFAKAILQREENKKVLDEKLIFEKWKKESSLARCFLILLSAYFKEERFKGEGEIRAAFLPSKKSIDSITKIQYFEQENGILRPYMDVFFKHDYNDGKAFCDECPIKSITIGPGGDQESVFDSIVHRLEYGQSKIWNYSIDELSTLLSEFVFGCFTQFQDDIKDEDFGIIANMIANRWCDRTGYTFVVKEATRVAVVIELKKDAKNISREEVLDKNNCDRRTENIINKFFENNFLSTRGIWIKKSSLSYIF